MGKKLIRRYSVWFLITGAMVYGLFFFYGKSFVYTDTNGAGDGLVQHYTALAYYGKWLRTLLHSLFVEHRLSVPAWDLSIGLGGDVLATLNYYVIGDLLNLLAAAVPEQGTELLYHILVLLRLYLAGLAFLLYCRHHGYGEEQSLIGTLVYVFSFYTIVVSVLHPFFLNPLIYFPLILLGVDLLLESRRVWLLMLACWLAAVSNFYFFYMLSIFMVIYGILRYGALYGRKGKLSVSPGVTHFLGLAGRGLLACLVGIVLAYPLLFPSAMGVLGGARLNGGARVPVLYEGIYYLKLGIAFFNASADYYSALGYTSVGVLGVLFLFFGTGIREKLSLKAGFALGTLFLLFPFFGHVLNGFSYVTNRWVWAYCFVTALVIVDRLPEIKKRGWTMWAASAGTFFAAVPTFLVRTGGDREKIIAAGLTLAVAALVLAGVCIMGRYRKKFSVYLGVTAVSLSVSAWGFYAPWLGNELGKHDKLGEAYESRMSGFFELFEEKAVDVSGTRIDTVNLSFPEVKVNSAMLRNVNSTSFYFSVSSKAAIRFLWDMELPVSSDYQYVNLDGRTLLETLLGCRYLVIKSGEEAYLPYGYDRIVTEGNGYSVYENERALPLAYFYSSYLREEEYLNLTAVQKQQALLQTCILKEAVDLPEVTAAQLEFTDTESLYERTGVSGDLQAGEHEFIVTGESGVLKLSAETAENAERYFSFENFSYTGEGVGIVVIRDGETERSFQIRSREDNFYSGVSDILCNLGYRERHAGEYELIFSGPGTYRFDNITIRNQPMEEYGELVSGLTREAFEYRLEEDKILLSGDMTEDGLLYLAIPYSPGWSAKVDGEKVPCLEANRFGIAVFLTAGEHEIELEYHTPYQPRLIWELLF